MSDRDVEPRPDSGRGAGYATEHRVGGLDGLPPATRDVLLVAAADESGDLDLVLHAASVTRTELIPAEHARLIRVDDGRIGFVEPDGRAVVYDAYPLSARIAAHRALADALCGASSTDRNLFAQRARHLAAAAIGPDPEAAGCLSTVAEWTVGDDPATAATAWERAAALSDAVTEQVDLLTSAAEAAVAAGRFDRASAIAGRAWNRSETHLQRARIARVRAAIELECGAAGTAARFLCDAASAVAAEAPGQSAAILATAAYLAWLAGAGPILEQIAAAAERQVGADETAAGSYGPVSDVAHATAMVLAGETEAGTSRLRRALDASSTGDRHRLPLQLRTLVHAMLGDDHGLYTSTMELAGCPLRARPAWLLHRARAELFLGWQRRAGQTATLAVRAAVAGTWADSSAGTCASYWIAQAEGVLARIAAIEGDEAACRRLSVERSISSGSSGDAGAAAWHDSAIGLLDLVAGRVDAAADRLAAVRDGPASADPIALTSLPDHVEAAVLAGRLDSAHESARRFASWAAHTGQDWALAVAERCRALLAAETDVAGRHLERAVDLHARSSGRPLERARTELLYGEWLRRARRRAEAREPLRSAYDTFIALGAAPLAERAAAELRATGAPGARRTGGPVAPDGRDDPGAASGPNGSGDLTPQETQVARLAAIGLSNREIGARLSLSPRTVGYHLYKVFPKLGIRSRAELAELDLGGAE